MEMELYKEIELNVMARKDMVQQKFYIGRCPFCDGKGSLTDGGLLVECFGCKGFGFGWIRDGGICAYR